MKKLLGIILAGALLFGLTGIAAAADNGNHSVTVMVNAINELAIDGGGITLTIDSATAGDNPDNATDETTCDLRWTTNEPNKKIVVKTSKAHPTFTLKVAAVNATTGTAAGAVTLSTTDQDFVTGISKTFGACNLSYTAIALASDGTDLTGETHTITYTLTD